MVPKAATATSMTCETVKLAKGEVVQVAVVNSGGKVPDSLQGERHMASRGEKAHGTQEKCSFLFLDGKLLRDCMGLLRPSRVLL